MKLGDRQFVGEQGRTRIAWTLILLSPFVASLMSASAFKLVGHSFAPTFVYEAAPLFALATSPLAAIGPAVGSLLLQASFTRRIILGMVFGLLGFIIFWATRELVLELLGLTIYSP
jgi:hypothetical protein